MKRGTLGMFILPFFAISFFLAILGFGLFCFLLLKNLIKVYLFVKFSIGASSSFLSLQNLNLIPGVLIYLGILLFIVGTVFTAMIMIMMRDDLFSHKHLPLFLTYLIIYPILGPVISVTATFKLIRKDMSW